MTKSSLRSQAASSGQVRRLIGTPDLMALHALAPARYPFLLESAAGAGDLGRFDILFACPGETLTLTADWELSGPGADGDSDFLQALDRWWLAERLSEPSVGPLPFQGGWFVVLAYELAQQIEPTLHLTADPAFPVARAIRVPAAVIRDRLNGQSFAFAEEGRYELLQTIEADVGRLGEHGIGGNFPSAPTVERHAVAEDDSAAFLNAVRMVKQRIAAGDVYQANISRRWSARITESENAWALYDRLRHTNPAPFAGLARLNGDCWILCSSPERLLRIKDGRVETRPIAGTRPRRDAADPEELRRTELIANPKERAEHVMLIDLERSDLGRVCRPGSVRVDEFMIVESYAHVDHIVSNVSGELRPEVTPGGVLRAVFPGGTITGCPKVRCMSIINELEGRPRGLYTGSMGYLNRNGSGDFNILIRTMTLQGRELVINAGSGIVADSDPERELDETRAKAKGMLLSLNG